MNVTIHLLICFFLYIHYNLVIIDLQSDYLRKISLKMLTMETKNPMPNAMQSNSSNNGQNPPDPGKCACALSAVLSSTSFQACVSI